MSNRINNKFSAIKSEFAYKLALWNHQKNLPSLTPDSRLIVNALKQEGVYMTSLSELGLSSTSKLLDAASVYLPLMVPTNTSSNRKLPQIYTVTDLPEFHNWGSEQKLLSIIENYIGLPVAFHGVHLRKDFPSNNQFGTLLWHKDAEDRRMFKAIVYLSDVEEKHGPFQYIPKSLTKATSLNYYRTYYKIWKSGYLGISDEQIKGIIPQSQWKLCPGPAGTVIFVDTRAVLHHGTLRSEERSALFFTYTANPPKRPELCTQYWDDSFPKPPELLKEVVNSQ